MKTKLRSRRATLISLSVSTVGAAFVGCFGSRESSAPPPASDDDDTTAAPIDCDQTGHQTEGPYYPGEPGNLLDITGGRGGVPLQVELLVVDVQADCAPIAGAEVDLWHADASGNYSGYEDFNTEGEDWLRGQQITGSKGQVHFGTIFPGSYPGRSVHLHVKVRATGFDELTTQVYFPADLAAAILASAGYAGAGMTAIGDDNFYSPETMMEATGDSSSGVVASIVLGVS